MRNLAALLNKANQLFKTGDLDAAAPLYRQALALDAANPAALTSLGTICLAKGDYQEAAHWLKQALVFDPVSVTANSNLGFILLQTGNYLEAAEHLMAALKKEPGQDYLWNDLGEALYKSDQLTGAITCYKKALGINPANINSYSKLALIYDKMNKYHEAAAYYLKAASLNPDSAFLQKIYEQLFSIYRYQIRDIDQAVHYAKLALTVNSDNMTMKTLLSFALFRQGNVAQGVALYLEADENLIYIRDDIPRWQGEIFSGKRILILNDAAFIGGLGDIMQFVRYVPLVKARGGHVTVLAKKELFRLLKSLDGADAFIVSEDIRGEDFDLQVPFIMLPVIFGTSLKTIPAQIPYLSVDPQLDAFWKKTVENSLADNRPLKVGLVWACKQNIASAANRTCDFKFFMPLKDIQNITCYSLQIGENAKDYLRGECSGFKIIDLTGHIEDFADTAAFINNLDLVISIDTSVAHLAGAMGKPVWILVNSMSSVSEAFLIEKEDCTDSPWYPTMRVFRAKTHNGWGEVFEKVCQNLQLVCQNRELLF